MRNSGHTIGNARWEAGNVRDVLTYYSAAPERLFGRQIPVAGGVDVTFHEPLGVVGVIVPWNFPMPIAGWAFAPALAAGNTVVLKPAELTPLTAIRLGELALEAGLPEDVFTVLPGKGSVVGQRLVEHPDVRKIVFTGSTEVGKGVMAGCAAQVKRVTLELGGKSANVVFADADLERAAATAPYAVFDNAGQDCCARSRILVQRSAYDRFLELLEPAVQGVRVEDPSLGHRRDGPADQPRPVGAGRLLRAGRRPGRLPRHARPTGPGFWFPPTVLAPVDPTATARSPRRSSARSSPSSRSTTRTTPCGIANEGEYGLSGSIWTRDLGRALRVSRGIEAGNLSVNSHSSVRYSTPFGGFKQSGLGRELGPGRAARVHRREERLHLYGRVTVSGVRVVRRLVDRVAVVTGGAAASGWPPPAGSPPRARTSSSATSTRPPARRRPTRSAACSCQVDVTSPEQVDALFQAAVDTYGGLDVAFNNAGISPPDDDSILTTGLDAWRRVQEVNLTSVYLCCKAAIPHMQARGRGSIINTALVRRPDGRGDLADLLHRVQGRRAGDVPRARRAVRPRGHPGQRPLPRAGEHPAAPGAVRQGPRAGRPPARAHPGGAVRRARRDRGGRRLPRLRRLVVHHGVGVPRRRRHQRGLRHAALRRTHPLPEGSPQARHSRNAPRMPMDRA